MSGDAWKEGGIDATGERKFMISYFVYLIFGFRNEGFN